MNLKKSRKIFYQTHEKAWSLRRKQQYKNQKGSADFQDFFLVLSDLEGLSTALHFSICFSKINKTSHKFASFHSFPGGTAAIS